MPSGLARLWKRSADSSTEHCMKWWRAPLVKAGVAMEVRISRNVLNCSYTKPALATQKSEQSLSWAASNAASATASIAVSSLTGSDESSCEGSGHGKECTGIRRNEDSCLEYVPPPTPVWIFCVIRSRTSWRGHCGKCRASRLAPAHESTVACRSCFLQS